MSDQFVAICVEELLKRVIPEGGFGQGVNGPYRPDATAWAVLALASVDGEREVLDRGRSRLKMDQNEDGRISVQKHKTAAYWPTPLAILAWQGAPAYREAQERAVRFLLSATGHSFPKKPYLGHDTTLRGWSWIEGTHSWVEPTALAVLALKRAGYQGHDRVSEARRMMLDRQLPHGGWNYGNTRVFDKAFRPLPYSTGMLLSALAGSVDRLQIQKSIDYLKRRVQRDRTPLSLGWEIIGLKAWGEGLSTSENWLMECWHAQQRYGTYNTTFLSIIVLAHSSISGNGILFEKENSGTA